jgi:hypothetical protein
VYRNADVKEEQEGTKKGGVFSGNGVRIDEKTNNPRKSSQVIQQPEE